MILIKLILKYVIIINVIVFICYDNLLLMYRSMGFCMLILCPITVFNLIIISNGILAESLGFSLYKIMSPANRHNFPFQFGRVQFLFLAKFFYLEL